MVWSKQVGEIGPDSEVFSGFVFKLQANLNPKHRDRVAFVRICSGKFEKVGTSQSPSASFSLVRVLYARVDSRLEADVSVCS